MLEYTGCRVKMFFLSALQPSRNVISFFQDNRIKC